MTEKLLPCPFCGESDAVFIGAHIKTGTTCIKCLHCKMLTADFDTRDDAITFWNTRADHIGDANEMIDHIPDATKMIPLQKWKAGSKIQNRGWYWVIGDGAKCIRYLRGLGDLTIDAYDPIPEPEMPEGV